MKAKVVGFSFLIFTILLFFLGTPGVGGWWDWDQADKRASVLALLVALIALFVESLKSWGQQHDKYPLQSVTSTGGAASNVSGRANVSQTVNVAAPKTSRLTSVEVLIVAFLLGAIASVYASHQVALWRAPEITINGTETLLGIAKGAIEIAQANQASQELLQKLDTLSSQARAVQANAASLQQPKGTASLQADFWLTLGQGAKLPEEGTVGVNYVYGPGSIRVSFNNNGGMQIPSGQKLSYKAKNGTECYLVYVGASPDGKLHGFKTWCGA